MHTSSLTCNPTLGMQQNQLLLKQYIIPLFGGNIARAPAFQMLFITKMTSVKLLQRHANPVIMQTQWIKEVGVFI